MATGSIKPPLKSSEKREKEREREREREEREEREEKSSRATRRSFFTDGSSRSDLQYADRARARR